MKEYDKRESHKSSILREKVVQIQNSKELKHNTALIKARICFFKH
jgi:hypothetical protein